MPIKGVQQEIYDRKISTTQNGLIKKCRRPWQAPQGNLTPTPFLWESVTGSIIIGVQAVIALRRCQHLLAAKGICSP